MMTSGNCPRDDHMKDIEPIQSKTKQSMPLIFNYFEGIQIEDECCSF